MAKKTLSMSAKSPEAIQRQKDRVNARRLANPESYNEYGRKWYQDNKGPELRAKRAAYDRERYRSNPIVKLAKNMRVRLKQALGKNKSTTTENLVGCTFDCLKSHIEKQFRDGMSWDNYGKWEIDHIIPLASATDEKDLIELCKYQNLQPLWSLENRKKSKKIQRVG